MFLSKSEKMIPSIVALALQWAQVRLVRSLGDDSWIVGGGRPGFCFLDRGVAVDHAR
jgi:hypothetical protein